ncbi:hypothetical protein BaRGS_00033743, partial [Batillaria attramentaria]
STSLKPLTDKKQRIALDRAVGKRESVGSISVKREVPCKIQETELMCTQSP